MSDCCDIGVENNSYTPDNLLGCNCCLSSQTYTIASGIADIVRGSVLYLDAAAHELSNVPATGDAFAISPFVIDTTSGSIDVQVYVQGEFNESEANGGVQYNGGDVDDVKDQLSLRGILLQSFEPA